MARPQPPHQKTVASHHWRNFSQIKDTFFISITSSLIEGIKIDVASPLDAELMTQK